MAIDQADVRITMSDGVEVSVRIFRPEGEGPFPTLFAASPYRHDNDDLPPTMVYFWLEVGPIGWYVDQGYAYVHLDIRGSGRSGGDYGFFDKRERRDLYETIEWIAAQPWSNGKVGGIGQSYYAVTQWAMAAERPPHLACIAPYDGHNDIYRGWAYHGGVACAFISNWWNNSVRVANKFPANGQLPRDLDSDLSADILRHPTLDEYWQERSFADDLKQVDIPVYSIGVWGKRELHLAGNLDGYNHVRGPKKLKVLDITGAEALRRFATVELHQALLLPFYDRWLKGVETEWEARPAVEYDLCASGEVLSGEVWPPAEARPVPMFLGNGPTGSVHSLNDGALAAAVDGEAGAAGYDYPQPQWVFGPAVFTRFGPDTTRETLTFTSPPLAADYDVAGTAELVLNLSSTRDDAHVIVRLLEQLPQDETEAKSGKQPLSRLVSKGWLKASHRAGLKPESKEGAPVYDHQATAPLVPGEPVELRVPLTQCAHRFHKRSRIRLEIACGDSVFSDQQFAHIFQPQMVGRDTIHFGGEQASRVLLPANGSPRFT